MKLNENNRILDTDSYKASHWKLYPPKTEATFSYLESRGNDEEDRETVFFGLQYILKKYFSTPITLEEVEEAKSVIEAHGEPYNYEGWLHIVNDHKGKLPLIIRAVKEGTVVPISNCLMTVETTCKKCFWLASYVETALMRIWYPISVASVSYKVRKTIYEYLQLTADDPDAEIDFKLHDFGSRGGSSRESVGIGGTAHLVNFKGSDTMQALIVAKNYYNCDMAAFSIPAGEHSTFSSWGREGELDAYRNVLTQYGQKGKLVSVVSDTWDIYNACEKFWGEELKQEVIDSGAVVVIRPDSGNPVNVLCGFPAVEIDGKYYSKATHTYEASFYIPEKREMEPHFAKGILQILAEKFGYTINSKGYKVLNHVRIIQGDGVNPESIKEILEQMTRQGFSTTNIAFGMGGALLQKVNRDTWKMAYKCSAIKIDGEWQDVYKDPVTDSEKRSKKGRLDLAKTITGTFTTINIDQLVSDTYQSEMITYYENGEVLVDDSLDEIRKRVLLTFTKKYDTMRG